MNYSHFKTGVPNLFVSASPHWYKSTQKITGLRPLKSPQGDASPRLGTRALRDMRYKLHYCPSSLKIPEIISDRIACRQSSTGTRCQSLHECGTSFTWQCHAVRGHLSERSNRFHPGNSRFNSRSNSCHFRRRRQVTFRLLADRVNGDDATIVGGNGAKKRDSSA